MTLALYGNGPPSVFLQVALLSLLSGVGWRLAEEVLQLIKQLDGSAKNTLLLLLISMFVVTVVKLRFSKPERTTRMNSPTPTPTPTPFQTPTNSTSYTPTNSPTTPTHAHRFEEEFLSQSPPMEEPFCRAVQARQQAHALPPCPTVNDEHFYAAVYRKCCESVIGKVQLPVGLVGPIALASGMRFLPLATVEGALVASVNRGCKALAGGSVSSVISGPRGMTRGPCIEAPSIECARDWLADFCDPGRFDHWRSLFDQSSPGGHVHLQEIRGRQVGRLVFLRFRADCDEAMGMNMMSRGCEYFLSRALPPGTKYCLSGNFCTDKKPSAVNWIEGRGRCVIVEATIPATVASSVLKVKDIPAFCRFATQKNLIGSAAAGSLGGFNAHVANTVAAAYLATGQDVAQVVDASAAMTVFEVDQGGNLRTWLTIPCLEVGFRGGGTGLPQQEYFLKGVSGCSGPDELAEVIAIAALGGEISLMAALWNDGELVRAHHKLNK